MNLFQRIEQTQNCSKKQEQRFLDGTESAVQISQNFSSEKLAIEKQQQIIQLAKQIQTDNCQIQSQIQACKQGYQLNMQLNFCCQAEAIIFQMRMN